MFQTPFTRGALATAATAAALAMVATTLWPWGRVEAQQQPKTGTQSLQGPAGAIYVDDGGGTAGLPVLFLHSFGGDSSHWSSALAHMRHDRRALAMDLRSHGKSAHPRDGDLRIEAFARDVKAVVDQLKLDRFVLVGHSLGGVVAAHYAARHPKNVAGLVLVGTPGKAPAEQSKQVLDALESNYDATMRSYWEKLTAGSQAHVRTQILEQANGLDRKEALAIIRGTFSYDTARDLDRYKGPKLVIYTDSQDAPHDLHKRPEVPSARVSGTGHWPHMDKPKEFTDVLDRFLASLVEPAPKPS